MTTIYEHTTDAARIEAVKRWDGTTDIMMERDMGTTQMAAMLHNLPINESDKFGAALCRDVINNYMEHIDLIKQRNEGLQSIIMDSASKHDQRTHALNARIEYLEAVNDGLRSDLSNIRVANTLHKERCGEGAGELDDCKEAFFTLLDERSELEAINRGLERDVSNLRMSNALYRKRWNEHETESEPSESRGMRSQNFERLVKGYHGMLTRNGKTITITLPFEHESVARNAEKYIVGLED